MKKARSHAKGRSPDGAQRNPGTTVTLICRTRITLRFIRATKKRESGAPRGASNHGHTIGCGSAPCDRRARLSALHRGSRLGDRTPPLSSGPRLLVSGSLRRRVQPDTWQTGHNAGRHSSLHLRKLRTLVCAAQSRPGAECKSARRRRTRSAFRLAFRKASLTERDDCCVTETRTTVNISGTRPPSCLGSRRSGGAVGISVTIGPTDQQVPPPVSPSIRVS
jgi:hypothetical protein